MILINEYKLIYVKNPEEGVDAGIYASKSGIPAEDDIEICTVNDLVGKDLREGNGYIYKLVDGNLEHIDKDLAEKLYGVLGTATGSVTTELGTGTESSNHQAKDENNDGDCDICGADMPAEPVGQADETPVEESPKKSSRSKKAAVTEEVPAEESSVEEATE